MDIEATLRQAIAIEREALDRLAGRIGPEAVGAVELLHACQGRIVVTGMGKAGIIGRKMAATFSSTGCPALFLHPGEALHGDLGIVGKSDVVIAISNSGETEEIIGVLPHLRGLDAKVIAMTGHVGSTLAKLSDVVLDIGVDREADPLGMVPTASTTAALALGDALASALMVRNGFDRERYAVYHPGGSIGRTLLSRVCDLMHGGDAAPLVCASDTLRHVICVMSSKRLGAAFIVDEKGVLEGILTDGDLRRTFEKDANPLEHPIAEYMTHNPRRVGPDDLAVDALRLMEKRKTTILPVVDDENRPIGALHLHDLVQAGLSLWTPSGEE